MSEIEKLYRNAECTCVKYNILCEQNECKNGKNYDCEGMEYLPFTAEKQISVIIFLSHKSGKGLLINLRAVDKDMDIYDFELFAECLAKLVNNLWTDLTAEERKQINEILEC